MIARVVELVLRRRMLTCMLLALSLVGAAALAARIEARFQYRDFYSYPGNPLLEVFQRCANDFGDRGGNAVVLIEAGDVFEPKVLHYLADLSQALESNPVFSDVKSLVTQNLVHARGEDVATGPLLSGSKLTAAAAADARKAALSSGLLARTLISRDGKATALLARLRKVTSTATIDEQQAAVSALQAALAAHPAPPGVTARITGQPQVEVETTRALTRDLLVLTPLTLLVLTVALFLTFRTLHGVLLVLGTVSVTALWTAGLYAALGRPVDIVGSVIPTVLLVYGAVDPIFVLTRYLGKIELGLTREDAIRAALSEMGLPCFLTSLTTAVGFAAFATATLPTIRYFGIVLAAGVMLAFVTTITVLPLLLSLTPPPRRAHSSLGVSERLDAALARGWAVLGPRRAAVVGLASALLLAGALAGRGLRINNEYVGSLPSGRALQATRDLESRLSGVIRVVTYLEGPAGVMKRPEVLRAVEAISAAARRQPLVSSSLSLADLVAEANQAFELGQPEQRRVPDSAALVTQYLTLIDPRDRADFVTEDYARANVLTFITDEGSEPTWRVRDAIQAAIDEQRLERFGLRASITGLMGYHELDRAVREVLWGFVIAFAAAVALQWLMFKSLGVALVSILPNLIPLAACFATMRMLGLGLRIDSSLFLCVSVGGLFNTTIHIVARVLQQLETPGADPDAVVARALRTVGPASFYTAAILSLGFAVLLGSEFAGLRQLGLLSMVTLVTGFLSDVIVTSALMRFYTGRATRRSLPPALQSSVDLARGS